MKIPISEYAWLDLDAPTLPAVECVSLQTSGIHWAVWCKYCEEYHRHGAMEGHRKAHCVGETPYTRTGYNLALLIV